MCTGTLGGGGGGAEAPFTVKTSPLFGENALRISKTVNFGNFRKMHPSFPKGGCWNRCRKGVSLSVTHNNCVLLKTL